MRIYYAGWENCAPGHCFGPAVRPHYLMHMIIEGKGRYEAAGVSYELSKGQAFLIHPREVTYYQADREEPWIYSWVAFDGPEVEKLLGQTYFAGSPYVTPSVIRPEDVERIRELVKAFECHESNPLELTACFYKVLALMYGKQEMETEHYERRYYDKAVEYMQHNYSYPLKIREVAGYIGIDRTYLYKIFMEFASCSPKQYLQKLRLKEAMGMLMESRYSVTETAYSCGFGDAAAFCNYMKREMGVTPLQFQEAQKPFCKSW